MSPVAWMDRIGRSLGQRMGIAHRLLIGLGVGRICAIALIVMSFSLLFLQPVQAENYDKEDLQGRSFAEQDIGKSSFVKANLRQANFSRANAEGVSLFGANLTNANLQAANLRGATLDMADLTGADLKDAVLESGMMWLTKFNNADIVGADFTDALLRSDAQLELCQRASGVNSVTGRATRDTLDCD